MIKMHGFQKVTKIFLKKIIKNFPLITQFFYVPFDFAVKSQEMAIPDF